ncbi:molecular chaperone DnaJ [Hahella sp. CCB-MM4]|uniref:molecular chaperone DnaJ n=1 Tax=Hahella sp. (strain CCB-MM4) TaxID=1926491 RepID=UPI000B9AD432|nr:molecular chaperone DnaJ [Hahella sp. CCB-MM4]OZG71382.1 molecular chaperone DnaJ [Hahella sp. CCB-MM4]
MQIFLGIALLLVVFYLLNNAFKNPSTPSQKRMIYIALGLAGIILLMLVITGRLHILAALGAAALLILRQLPWILKSLPVIRQLMGNAQSSMGQGQESTLETSLIRMSLDHASGAMDGTILTGTYTGQRLSAMSVQQLADLYRTAVRGYSDSIEVLETYFERTYGVHWRTQFEVDDVGSRDRSSNGSMSMDDAKDILGLEGEVTKEQVVEAHRRLMQKFHPDRGGSNYLAAKINEAKKKLLDELR